jgi:hypothetical protein
MKNWEDENCLNYGRHFNIQMLIVCNFIQRKAVTLKLLYTENKFTLAYTADSEISTWVYAYI